MILLLYTKAPQLFAGLFLGPAGQAAMQRAGQYFCTAYRWKLYWPDNQATANRYKL
jgi:hypothetical protein